jgi:RNA polymerase sigma-70 factor (ECF subfamily)
LQEADERARFEAAVLPHLAAAHNLARWLTRDDHDAQDMVQEAFMRAWKSFGGFHGVDGRTWLLAIVRNACYTWLDKKRAHPPALNEDASRHAVADSAQNPENVLQREEERRTIRMAMEGLPLELRETLILRELEGLSYKEIAAIAVVPLGTVMSRLARARERLQQCLRGQGGKET